MTSEIAVNRTLRAQQMPPPVDPVIELPMPQRLFIVTFVIQRQVLSDVTVDIREVVGEKIVNRLIVNQWIERVPVPLNRES